MKADSYIPHGADEDISRWDKKWRIDHLACPSPFGKKEGINEAIGGDTKPQEEIAGFQAGAASENWSRCN